MRIIPKKTKVSMEFFKGIEIPDVLVGTVGITIVISVLFSNLPYRMGIALGIAVLFGASIIPIDGDKGYRLIYNVLKYLARYRVFKEEPAKKGEPAIKDITPFTGIDGSFIEYGGEYYGIVVSIPDIEFKFYTEARQNQMIDHVFGSVLRTISGSESASLIKIDRPILYDSYLAAEDRKLAELKEAYINGLLNEEELTTRVGIIQDRKEQIRFLNDRDKVYAPFYYLAFFHKDKEMLLSQARNMVNTMSVDNWNCKILSEKELVVFLKYNYTLFFDEREVYQLTKDQYMDWILPKQIKINSRTVQYDNIVTHNFRVTDYPTLVGNAWGANLFSKPDTKVVMKMQMVDQYKGIRQIDRAIDELREQSNSTGKTSKLMELQTHVDTLVEVLAMLQSDNETLLDVNIFVTAYDYELSEQLLKPGK
ncbi:MAG: hypothetical protein SPF91_01385, partial [Clostridium sp.]|nr:hypothetical protein [Clostridium sp.]